MSNIKKFLKAITVYDEEKADNILINSTMSAMENKLEKKRNQGRGGWWEEDCEIEELWIMVNDHIDLCKNDPKQIIDVINLLSMIRYKLKNLS